MANDHNFKVKNGLDVGKAATIAGGLTVGGDSAGNFADLRLTGSNPAVYFKDIDGSTAWHLGHNSGSLYVLEDSDRNQTYNSIRSSWTGSVFTHWGNIELKSSQPVLKLCDMNSTGSEVSSWISFQDSNLSEVGYVGYGSGSNTHLYVRNTLGRIELNATHSYFTNLDLAISNSNSDHNAGTYFRGSNTHFVLGLKPGNTLFLNYGNSSGPVRLYSNNFMFNDQTILNSSRDLTNIANGTFSGTVTAASFSGALDYNDITNPPPIDNSVDYINAASFNTTNGVLTLSGVGRAGATVDLDGRYLQSYSESDTLGTVTGRGATTSTPITIQGTTRNLLTLYNDVNGAGAGIQFSDVATSQSQKGFLYFEHQDSDSNGRGASFHFDTDQPNLAVIIPTGSDYYVGTDKVWHAGNFNPNNYLLTSNYQDNYVDSVAFNTSTGVLTLGRTGSLTDLTVDLDGRYSTTDTNDVDYINAASFNTTNGVLTLSGVGRAGATVDLDNRYAYTAHDHDRLIAIDDRDMKPNTSGIQSNIKAIRAFFSSGGGMTGSANSDYKDVLVLDTYSDSSGGGPNAITFDKGSAVGDPQVHIWKGAWGGTTWGTGQRVFADNYHPNADKWTTARTHTVTLTGDVSGTASQSVDGTGNRAWSINTSLASHVLEESGTLSGSDVWSGKINNSATSASWFGVSNTSATDRPTNDSGSNAYAWGVGLSINKAGQGALQVYTPEQDGATNGGMFYRTGWNGNIRSWQRLFDDEYHPNADKWTTARTHTVTLTGQVTGSASQTVDGTGNRTWTISTTLNDSALDDQYVTVGSRHTGDASGLVQPNKASIRIWDVSTSTDKPSGAADGLVLSAGWDSSSWGVQQYHDFHTNDLYLRSKQNGTFSSWNKVWTEGNFDPSDYLLTANYVDTDNYVDSVSFSTTTGVLTLGRTGSLPDLTVDLDGRYQASLSAPAAPSITSTSVVGETIEVVFSQSTTTGVEAYEVWSDSATGDYNLIAKITDEDFAASMSVVDTTFEAGTINYRVFAIKNGIYSTPATTSKAFTAPSLDVANLQVVPDLNVFHIDYNIPDSRFVEHVEIYVDINASSSSLSRTNASLVYSGSNSSFTYNISASQRDDFHQFWVEVA